MLDHNSSELSSKCGTSYQDFRLEMIQSFVNIICAPVDERLAAVATEARGLARTAQCRIVSDDHEQAIFAAGLCVGLDADEVHDAMHAGCCGCCGCNWA